MKKKSLRLHKESLRHLTPQQLGNAAGGLKDNSIACTWTCRTCTCPTWCADTCWCLSPPTDCYCGMK
jgi:hypothetical protein